MNSVAKLLVDSILHNPIIGKRLSSLLYQLGAIELSRRTAFRSGFIPEILRIDVKGLRSGTRRFRMYTANDLVATVCWRNSYENYESPLPLIYACLIQNARIVIGVGANTGLYELMAAAISPIAHVYAFEPFPPAFEKLSRNIGLNTFGDRVFPIEMALSDKVGIGKMYIPFEHNFPDMVPTNVSLSPEFHDDVQRTVSVNVATLDQFVQERKLRHIDVLRIDAEGTEDLVLLGGQSTLRNFRPYVFVEILEGRVNHAAIDSIRKTEKYDCFSLERNTVISRKTLQPLTDSPNQLLCPHEKREHCLSLLKYAGLRVE